MSRSLASNSKFWASSWTCGRPRPNALYSTCHRPVNRSTRWTRSCFDWFWRPFRRKSTPGVRSGFIRAMCMTIWGTCTARHRWGNRTHNSRAIWPEKRSTSPTRRGCCLDYTKFSSRRTSNQHNSSSSPIRNSFLDRRCCKCWNRTASTPMSYKCCHSWTSWPCPMLRICSMSMTSSIWSWTSHSFSQKSCPCSNKESKEKGISKINKCNSKHRQET